MNKRFEFALCVFLSLMFSVFCTHAEDDARLVVSGKGATGELSNAVFSTEYPDITWRSVENLAYGSAQELAQNLINNDSDIDIYAINYSYGGFEQLTKKGFAADLTEYGDLLCEINRMYPYVRDAVMSDGKLYAIPVSMSCYSWGYSPRVWNEAGLQEVSIPTTYHDLLDFVAWWIEEGAYAHPEYQLMRGVQDVRNGLAYDIIYTYINTRLAQNKVLRMDEPELLDLLVKLDAIDTSKIDETMRGQTEGMSDSADVLLTAQKDLLDLSISDVSDSNNPLLLTFSDEEKPIAGVEMRLFFINPNSTDIDLAVQYLLCFLQGLDEQSQVLFYEDQQEAVLNPQYEVVKEETHAQLAAVNTQIQKADPELKSELMQAQDRLTQYIQNIERIKWLITAERIQEYKLLSPAFFVRKQSPLDSYSVEGGLEIHRLIDQYVQRHISAKEFTQKAESTLRMAILEDE